MTLPDTMSPEALADHMGWNVKRVRKLARDLGACRIVGNRMTLLPEDVSAIMEASRPCPSKSTNVAKSGTTAGPLPVGDYEVLRAQRARKSPSELPPNSKQSTGKVISMDRQRS